MNITIEQLRAAAIATDTKTGNRHCRLCGSVWEMVPSRFDTPREHHHPDCLLEEAGDKQPSFEMALKLDTVEAQLRHLKATIEEIRRMVTERSPRT